MFFPFNPIPGSAQNTYIVVSDSFRGSTVLDSGNGCFNKWSFFAILAAFSTKPRNHFLVLIPHTGGFVDFLDRLYVLLDVQFGKLVRLVGNSGFLVYCDFLVVRDDLIELVDLDFAIW